MAYLKEGYAFNYQSRCRRIDGRLYWQTTPQHAAEMCLGEIYPSSNAVFSDLTTTYFSLEAAVTDDRHLEFYKDFRLVADFEKGQFLGRAWPELPGLEILSAVGTSIPDVVEKLKALANVEARRRIRGLRETLSERHRQYIELRRVEYKGLRPISRSHRVTHCFECKTIVDNAVDLECITCGWIVCTECAACGCGYT